jgi:hypothetical protein
MRLLRHLQHWLSGRGPHLHVPDFVPESHPIRQWADTLLKHEWSASDEQICHRLRTDFAVMYACGISEVPVDRSQAHFVSLNLSPFVEDQSDQNT